MLLEQRLCLASSRGLAHPRLADLIEAGGVTWSSNDLSKGKTSMALKQLLHIRDKSNDNSKSSPLGLVQTHQVPRIGRLH